jgi:3'-phosphoadenosine 5'-phosphosulfate sulfotransferase (PAPS reductase)/FAD synthetase
VVCFRVPCRPSALAFSFNGGKDSTAVLHLLLGGVRAWQQQADRPYAKQDGLLGIRTFFFLDPNEFPEIHQFVNECDSEYHLKVHFYSTPFKQGMQQMVNECGIKAVFMGTRHGDPNCQDQVCMLSMPTGPLQWTGHAHKAAQCCRTFSARRVRAGRRS